MEIHENDRILLIDDDPMVRLMAVLAQYAEGHQALAERDRQGFDQTAPRFGSIFDPRR